jgi:hypothetical protein
VLVNLRQDSLAESLEIHTWEVVSLEDRDAGTNDRVVFPGVHEMGVRTCAAEIFGEGSYISLIEIMLSIFVIPNQ